MLSELLSRRWEAAEAAGALRTSVDDTLRRRLAGDLRVVVQFNPSHLKSKRPVDKQLSKSSGAMERPTVSAFNFTKAKRQEFLCGLEFIAGEEQGILSVEVIDTIGDGGEEVDRPRHFILVNVVPVVHGHFLFVPDMNELKPQKMEKPFWNYALSICHAMQREDFALGFNSAGAWSSVNHFHLQGFFFPRLAGESDEAAGGRNFPVTLQPREALFSSGKVVVRSVSHWKSTCYVVEPEQVGSNAQVVDVAWALLEILQDRGIPHNLLVADTNVFIFPRKPQCENGVGLFADSVLESEMGKSTEHAGRLRIAVAELSGLIIAGDSTAFENLTEDMFCHILKNEVSLPENEEAAILAEWKTKLGEDVTQGN